MPAQSNPETLAEAIDRLVAVLSHSERGHWNLARIRTADRFIVEAYFPIVWPSDGADQLNDDHHVAEVRHQDPAVAVGQLADLVEDAHGAHLTAAAL